MKSKVFVKKLTLNKKTIANLKKGKMREVYGGIPTVPTAGISCMPNGGSGRPDCQCGIEITDPRI